MIKLSDILSLVGYTSIQQQMSYCKLLALQGCFDKPDLATSKNLNISRAKKALAVWELLHLKPCHEEHKNHILRDDDAYQLLSTQFHSLVTGFEWLLNITQLRFLRPSYDDEGIGADKEQIVINTSQWVFNDEINLLDLQKENNSFHHELYQIFCTLNLIKPFLPLPESPIKHVVILSSLEPHVKERVNFLPDFSGVLYFVSGARGLFNCEASLAPILAEWFGMPEKEQVIQNILNKHSDFSDTYQWTHNLSALKQEILDSIEKKEWCNASDKSWFYKNSKMYDELSHLNKRDSLRDWPVAMDMLVFHLKKKMNPEKIKNIKLISLVVHGKNNKLPVTEDFISDWYHSYGHEVINSGEIPLFIACNTTHRLSYILENISRNFNFQLDLTRQCIHTKLNSFIMSDKGQDHIITRKDLIYVSGPKALTMSLKRGLDILARSLWPISAQINKVIAEHTLLDEKSENNYVDSVKRMIFYKDNNELMNLTNSSIDLGLTYYKDNDFIKTAGLFNFALSILKNNNLNQDKATKYLLIKSTIENIARFVIKTTGFHQHDLRSYLSHNLKMNKNRLQEIRNEIKQKFTSIKIDKSSIIQLYDLCFRKLNDYLITMINQSKELLYYQSTLFFGYLGSNASHLATPYSDLEFYILTHSEDEWKQAKDLTKMVLLLVLNLQETILRSLGIRVYDQNGREFNLLDKSFDQFCFRGFSFDFNNVENACKTPLGAKLNQKLLYRLIHTPETMSDFTIKSLTISPYLRQMLLLSTPLTGDKSLFTRFNYLASHEDRFDIASYAIDRLKNEIDSYSDNLHKINDAEYIDHKNYFYRPVTILIDNLYLSLAPYKNCNMFSKIDALFDHNIINNEQKLILENSLVFILYLKMKENIKWGENKYFLNAKDRDAIILKKFTRQLLILYTQIKESLNSNLIDDIKSAAKMCKVIRKKETENPCLFFNNTAHNNSSRADNINIIRSKL